MARLIDADALLRSEIQRCGCVPLIGSGYNDETSFKLILDKTPTVDAVEVVRCKDCKHWHEETGWCYHHSHFVDSEGGFCHPWESNDWKMLNADDFCSYGERKDND